MIAEVHKNKSDLARQQQGIDLDLQCQAFDNFSVFTLVEQRGTRFNAFGYFEQRSNQFVAGICQGVTIKNVII